MEPNIDSFLGGPRARRMCLELAMELDPEIRHAVFELANVLDPGRGISWVMLADGSNNTVVPPSPASPTRLAAAIATLDLTDLDEAPLQAALERAVANARYWQEPAGEDKLATLPAVRAAFESLAEHVLKALALQSNGGLRRREQWAIDWRSPDDPAPLDKDPRQALAKWACNARAEEERAARERPSDLHANWSGEWWSIPQGLVHTVGQVPAGFNLVEDYFGWDEATAIPVRGVGRTFEIRAADDWVSLCRIHPLEVTASRRHDWFRCTGRDGPWVIPDWERVAQEWDAVHLTTQGYLGLAGRALDVDTDTASVIAGWDPDSTFWLTDVAREWDGPRQSWHRAPGGADWIRVP
ncbi:hypothetical protein Q2T94_13880 [Paeniglutamicibacter sulfureus]|uniref:hypothetical protein n=1 Tax=Paeniglutamicibacter sulfureus TaxID=43666 RepID=UPI0026651EAC|nr:hypothetical protein [Paeniglutamicibacter sulfureus]MDO2935398.1 hypothetical protein [Paeniglutamicibacter sulfureus]